MPQIWLYVDKNDLTIERQQLIDEGRNISSVEKDFERYLGMEPEEILKLQPELLGFLDRTIALPVNLDYPYQEPSDLETIRRTVPAQKYRIKAKPGHKILKDKIYGAWLGRCAGCLLGKPVEGWHRQFMSDFLRDTENYPLAGYFSSDVPADIAEKYRLNKTAPFINNVRHMPEDDDTNYTVLGMAAFGKLGKNFTPENLAEFWMQNLPVLHTCTAERVAYRNFVNNVMPPASASFRNPYREWIGAQIRADFWGYVAPGEPSLASEYAWRDACISHVKNGIYGEMWIAAMLSAAAFTNNLREIIEAGLSQIPEKSRLNEAIWEVLGWHSSGTGYDEAVNRIHAKWNEKTSHHWCHVISNAQIVATGLLWGEGDFEKSICRAVQACFDTDCNGASVGSIMGMMLGASRLPEKWIKPLNDTLETGIAGYNTVKIKKIGTVTYFLSRPTIRGHNT